MDPLRERRRRLADALLDEVERIGGERRLRVCSPGTHENPANWSWSYGDPTYAWRCVLPHEVVFDVGDRGDWDRCRQTTHLLWTMLNRWGVPYWGALSGGKGTHTHVFLDPAPVLTRKQWQGKEHVTIEGADWRQSFAREVVWAMLETLPFWERVKVEDPWEHFDIDPVLVAPEVESRLIREFDSAGKRLWTMGPSNYRYLPMSRAEAYKYEGLPVPVVVPASAGNRSKTHYDIRQTLGSDCPRGPQCWPGPEQALGPDGTCNQCPTNR